MWYDDDKTTKTTKDAVERWIELWYPRNEDTQTHLIIDLMEVRAADPIRVSYDFDRDGWVIEQSKETETSDDWDWKEVAFIQAWAREEEDE